MQEAITRRLVRLRLAGASLGFHWICCFLLHHTALTECAHAHGELCCVGLQPEAEKHRAGSHSFAFLPPPPPAKA